MSKGRGKGAVGRGGKGEVRGEEKEKVTMNLGPGDLGERG